MPDWKPTFTVTCASSGLCILAPSDSTQWVHACPPEAFRSRKKRRLCIEALKSSSRRCVRYPVESNCSPDKQHPPGKGKNGDPSQGRYPTLYPDEFYSYIPRVGFTLGIWRFWKVDGAKGSFPALILHDTHLLRQQNASHPQSSVFTARNRIVPATNV